MVQIKQNRWHSTEIKTTPLFNRPPSTKGKKCSVDARQVLGRHCSWMKQDHITELIHVIHVFLMQGFQRFTRTKFHDFSMISMTCSPFFHDWHERKMISMIFPEPDFEIPCSFYDFGLFFQRAFQALLRELATFKNFSVTAIRNSR